MSPLIMSVNVMEKVKHESGHVYFSEIAEAFKFSFILQRLKAFDA